jgi:DNA topoisomerase IB/predicted ABC-type ATPase
VVDRAAQQLTDEAGVRGSEARVYRAALRAFRVLASEFRTALKASGYSTAALNARPEAWLAAVDELILPAIAAAYLAGGDLTLIAAGRVRKATLEGYLAPIRNRLVAVSDDVYDLISTNLAQARRDGATPEELADRVEVILADSGSANWPARAALVARTETTAAFNQGRVQAGLERTAAAGLDRRDVYKEWLATRDDRTRPSHRHVSGDVVAIGDRFRLISDQGVSFGFAPGDPSLPVWEVANCRCTLIVLLPGDDGYPDVERGWGDADVILAAYNEDQRRVPKGNGELSGRWVHTPGAVIRNLGDALGDALDGLNPDNDADLPEIASRLRAEGHDDAADEIDDYASVDWSKAPIAKVKVGEMTLADVPATMSFPEHDRTKPGMRALTPQDYVDHFNATGERVPPNWTSVLAATEPYDPATHANRLRVQGIDSLGNPQPLYDQQWNEYKAAIKWQRGDALAKVEPEIRTQIEADYATNPAAAALALQLVMGIRTGSATETKTVKGHKALGASTMPASAVRIDDDGTVHFDFIGKSGKRAELQSDDPLITDIMRRYTQGKSGDERLFDVSDGSVNTYFDKLQQGRGWPYRFTPKDFRTMHGTSIAQRMLVGRARAKDEKEYAAIRREVADSVSSFLNNTPTVALASYVAPTVWADVLPEGALAAALADPALDEPGTDSDVMVPLSWPDIAAAWAAVPRPDVDLAAFGDIDPAETYTDYSDGEYDDELTVGAEDEPIADEVDEMTAAAETDLAPEVTVPDDLGELGDIDPVPWHGVLAPEGVLSGDGRKFRSGALRWRDLPLPLSWQKATADGHGGSVVIGRIDAIERDPSGLMRASGVFDQSPEADEVVRQLAERMIRGVSVDVDDATFEYEDADGVVLDGDLMSMLTTGDPDPTMVVADGRISGATLCSIPAFQEAFVAIGEWDSVTASLEWPDDLDALDVAALRALETQAVVLPFRFNPLQKRDWRGRWTDGYGLPLPSARVVDFQGGSAMAHLVPNDDGEMVFTPERQAIHRKYSRATRKGAKSTGTFNILGGGPASGKSNFTKARPELEHGVALINPDDAKGALPEYHTKPKEEAAFFVHEESSYMGRQATADAMTLKLDVTMDGTGDSHVSAMRERIDTARAAGYEVNGYYVTVPTEIALERADKRAAKTGRHVPAHIVRGTHQKVSAVLPQIVDDFDNLELWDTDTQPMTLVASKYGRDSKLTVHHKSRWDYFKAKAHEGEKGHTMPDATADDTSPGTDAVTAAAGANAEPTSEELFSMAAEIGNGITKEASRFANKSDAYGASWDTLVAEIGDLIDAGYGVELPFELPEVAPW